MILRDSVNSQMRINKELILSHFHQFESIYDVNSKSMPIIIKFIDKFVSINDIRSSIEFKIPLIMLSISKFIKIHEFLGDNFTSSPYNDLIVILNNISPRVFNKDESQFTYWDNPGIKLLSLIRSNNIDSKEFRDDIYNNLGIVSRYIEYSDSMDYNFY